METTAQADLAKSRIVIAAWDPVAGAPQRLLTDGSGKLQVSGSFSGGGDGAIVDGVTPSIRASVLNAAPGSDTGQPALAVRVISQLGAVGGSGGNLATAAKGSTAAGNPTSEATNANIQALHVNVVNFPATQPVSGTFWQATQPVSGPLTDAQLRATPVPVSGTFWQATQPISVASLPLPTGAATETTLAALNTKVPANLTVTATRLLVDGSGVTQPVSGTFWQATQPVSGTVTANIGTSGSLALDATLTGGTQKTKLVDTGGTNVGSISAAGALKVDGSAVTQPISAVSLPLPTGASTETTLAALNTKIPSNLTVTSTRLLVDGSGVTQPISAAATLLVAEQATTTGGATTFHLVSAATTNATNIKASAGQVYGWYIYNSNAAARKVAFHNASGTPTAGASIFFTLVIPPNSAANVSFAVGIPFSTGIAISTVTGLADSDATAVAANDLNINIFYK